LTQNLVGELRDGLGPQPRRTELDRDTVVAERRRLHLGERFDVALELGSRSCCLLRLFELLEDVARQIFVVGLPLARGRLIDTVAELLDRFILGETGELGDIAKVELAEFVERDRERIVGGIRSVAEPAC
jgi:hypothetical protein